MPGILFTNVLMLAGMTALAVPVVVHLLLKRKTKKLRFSTTQFFVRQDEQSSRKRKLRHWFLLALRLLLFALLVLAFARPYLPQSRATDPGRKPRQVVLVIDRSASMQATGTDGLRWAEALRQMRKVLADLRADDRVALIGCSSHTEVLCGFTEPAAAARTLDSLLPAYSTSNLGEGLEQALKVMVHQEPNVVSTIYVVSDFQKSACRGIASCRVPDEIEIKPLAVGDLLSPNTGISELEIEPENAAKPVVAAGNFFDEETSELKLQLSVDNQVAFTAPVRLKGGSSTNLSAWAGALQPGWHDVKAVLSGKDALPLDNVRYSALLVPEPAKAVVVESRKSGKVFEEETFFVTTALDPSIDSSNSIPRRFQITKIPPEQLIDRITVGKGKAGCDLVILPGLKQLPAESGRSLEAFVRAGGGLLIFLGENTSANRYNSELGGLLPGRIGDLQTSPEADPGWRIRQFDTNQLAFAAFRLPNSGDLRIPEFRTRFLLEPMAGASAAAAFDDGIPLMLVRTVGNGRVALVNTSADTAWTDWPKHKTFVPWLHGLGKFLALKQGLEGIDSTNCYIAADDLEIDMGSAAAKGQFKMTLPNGKEVAARADDQGRLRRPEAVVPGVYSIRDGAGKEVKRFAVNIPAEESDLAALSPIDFQQRLVRVHEPPKTAVAASLFGSNRREKEFWRVLLLAVLALLFIEEFAANRTSA